MLKEDIVSAACCSWTFSLILVHFHWLTILYGLWEVKWCYSEMNICYLRLMTHQLFEVQLGPLAPKTHVSVTVYVSEPKLKITALQQEDAVSFKVMSFNSHAVLQRLESCVMAALIFKLYVSIQMTQQKHCLFSKSRHSSSFCKIQKHLIEYEKQGLPTYQRNVNYASSVWNSR